MHSTRNSEIVNENHSDANITEYVWRYNIFKPKDILLDYNNILYVITKQLLKY